MRGDGFANLGDITHVEAAHTLIYIRTYNIGIEYNIIVVHAKAFAAI